jgi:salicylate hydroxylase
MQPALIIGGGIGGLSAALALSQIKQSCTVFERTAQFSEVGAGLQLSPNVVKRLAQLGLLRQLTDIASFPHSLSVRNASNGVALGTLPLGKTILKRYGWPYMTVHRADLHTVLLHALYQTETSLHTQAAFESYQRQAEGIVLQLKNNPITHTGSYLIGADGLHSQVRQCMLNDGTPHLAGHIVYRGLIKQNKLPAALHSQQVTVWLAPYLHVVTYPIRGDDLLNIVVIMRGNVAANNDWQSAVNGVKILEALRTVSQINSPLLQFIEAVCTDCDWRVWNVYDRPPVLNANQMAHGNDRIALLGDAAHPMRPYLAQGAGMAIEDAIALADVIKNYGQNNVSAALNQYAAIRWRRCARVQARSQRNGNIFHATGMTRWARDMGIYYLGQRVLDVPWLYGR